ncbi:MAG: META domain-containing protein [Microcella sp.]|uniref:META domain-containing protein n=1 Tax=Microcella sp. TaxID=1913979 RepID=UPI0027190671|nr:META domain-containing protein [Microcella sp.]MDO8337793.1 META domain-containing protein [Microcella sp.]
MTTIRRRRRALALLAPLALVALLAGCADTAAEPLQGAWVLTSGADARGAFIDAASPITLEVEGRDFSGRSPCNSYSGTLDASAGGLGLGSFATTEAACADPEQMELEGRYYAALGEVERAERTAGELVLTGPGVELVFAAD